MVINQILLIGLQFRSLTDGVTDKILAGVSKLQRLGVSKVLVDSVPPFGCTPWRSWNNKYRSCDARSNDISGMHNAALRHKLARLDDVLVLDLEGIFSRIFSSGISSIVRSGSPTILLVY